MLALRDVTHLGCQICLSEAWGSPKDEAREVPAEGLWGDSDRASGGRISSPRAILPRCHERAAGPHRPRWPQLPRSHTGGRAPRHPTSCSGGLGGGVPRVRACACLQAPACTLLGSALACCVPPGQAVVMPSPRVPTQDAMPRDGCIPPKDG